MLYTFSSAIYECNELERYFSAMTEQDAVLLWQDGVLLPIKYPHYFEHCKAQCFALELDVSARNLISFFSFSSKVRLILLPDLVQVTEQFYPQLAL